jgi:hypothetical protein
MLEKSGKQRTDREDFVFQRFERNRLARRLDQLPKSRDSHCLCSVHRNNIQKHLKLQFFDVKSLDCFDEVFAPLKIDAKPPRGLASSPKLSLHFRVSKSNFVLKSNFKMKIFF